MQGTESNRRDFLKKLGLIAGATTLTAIGLPEVLLANEEHNNSLTPEQSRFMVLYEKWLDEFHAMAIIQQKDPLHFENNTKMMSLSKEAELWQNELIEHMKDPNFAQHYLKRIERVTASIKN
jgi:hypothetical protein